ncbi:MAG TPA: Hpt domain-containing protein [Polyangia bacterium]|nr:Hpt domain-containing protein [Polyangia bacterium]
MPGFSIDDVRDTFTADVSSLLGQVEETAQLLGSCGIFAADTGAPSEPRRGDQPAFAVIGDLGHAIGGTASLVGADSLADSAHALEVLAQRGQEAFADLDRCVARARRAAELCADGVQQMRVMLGLELDHRSSEAVWKSIEWIDAVSTWATGDLGGAAAAASAAAARPAAEEGAAVIGEESIVALAEAAAAGDAEPAPVSLEMEADFDGAAPAAGDGPAEFSFEDEPAAPAAIDAELRAIFDEEARSAVASLETELDALAAEPASSTVAGNLERLFHTLKGAAATVGLNEISAIAAALQERMEAVVESGTTVNADFIEELVSDINEMLRAAGLPIIVRGAAPEAAAGAGTPAHQALAFFIDEVREALAEVTAAIPALSASDGQTAARTRAELGRLFHRIKGSALIVGETEIGAESERLQLLMEGEGTTAVAAVAETEVWLALVKARLGRVEQERGGAAAPEAPAAAVTRHAVQMIANAELGDAFNQECSELLDAIDRELLNIEESSQPKQSLEALMRHIHTIKGVVNTVGLAPTGEMLHRVEDLLETLQAAPILPPMRAVATLLFGVQSDVRKHLKQAQDGYVEMDLPRLEARIARLLGGSRGAEEGPAGGSLPGLTGGTHPAGPSIETGASVHSIHSARSEHGVRSDEGRSGSAPAASHDDAINRRYIRVATERLDSLMNLAGELVVSRSRLLARVGTLRAVQQEISFGQRRLVETVESFTEEHQFGGLAGGAAASGERRARAAGSNGAGNGAGASNGHRDGDAGGERGTAWEAFGELELDRYEDIHVLSRRLTEMTSDFSEINQQLAHNLSAFNDDSELFGRIVSGIQSEVTRARMVPLEQLFTRLRLPVRDAATREGKEMRVAVEGADVNIDKTIADALFQPMLHLVRNSAVHGIEKGTARERAGKPATGTITLRARQESGQIVVEVVDDGAGLDLERLRARGAAMGLIAADTPLSDPAVRDLVFAPGLSTRDRAGAVSGRGVGCDVVRRSVERLNGDIRVESSPGRGTSFIITLPVTLAITKALIVRHGERSYAIPLHFAERIIDAQEEALIHSAGVHRIKVDDTFHSVKRLEHYFHSASAGAGATTGANGPVLLLRVGGARTVLQVDAVLGQEEVVVKSLGDVLAGHPVFAGVTVRGSGELVLILDVPGLLQERATGAAEVERRRAAPKRVAKRAVPVAAGRAGGAGPGPAGGPAPAVEPARRLKVLFIDDSLSVRKFALLTLTGLGADVTVAVDGVDGLAKIREGSFDLVFTDLEMPRMHGFELIRELRFLPAYRDLPIAVVTSRSGTKHRQQARELGATEYLTKPFTAQMLAEILDRVGRGASAPAPASLPGSDGDRSDASRREDGKRS